VNETEDLRLESRVTGSRAVLNDPASAENRKGHDHFHGSAAPVEVGSRSYPVSGYDASPPAYPDKVPRWFPPAGSAWSTCLSRSPRLSSRAAVRNDHWRTPRVDRRSVAPGRRSPQSRPASSSSPAGHRVFPARLHGSYLLRTAKRTPSAARAQGFIVATSHRCDLPGVGPGARPALATAWPRFDANPSH
jgi:hypothetical protein